MYKEESEEHRQTQIATQGAIEDYVSVLMRGQAGSQGDESIQPWLQSTARPNNNVSSSAGATSEGCAFIVSVWQCMLRSKADDSASSSSNAVFSPDTSQICPGCLGETIRCGK